MPEKLEIVRFVGKPLVTPSLTPAYSPALARPVKTVESPPNELPGFARVTKSPLRLPTRNSRLPAVMPVAWVIVPVRVSDAPSWVPIRDCMSAASSMFPLKVLFPTALWMNPRWLTGIPAPA